MIKDLTGKRFGRLTAIKYHDTQNHKARWSCVCECGNSVNVIGILLTSGNTKSCGCYHKERTSMAVKRHGMSKTPIHTLWKSMNQRCRNEKNPSYQYYGARGIQVCDRWLVFENFYEDMGNAPEGLTLDRIDNDGNYCKENCRWATVEEQQNNTRKNHIVTFKGKTQTLSMWCRELKLNYDMVWDRLKNNWNIERALTEPSGFSLSINRSVGVR